jgi:rubrerythrin
MSDSDNQTPQQQQRGHGPGLRGSRTQGNLERAFAWDAQTTQLLTYFARIARIEGYPDAARTFSELAESQVQFAHGHMDFLKRVGDPLARQRVGETHDNLLASIANEEQDSTENLVEMAQTAHAEGFPDIASWFESLADAKQARGARLHTDLDPSDGSDR